MENNQIIKNIDVDGTFLSLSLNERLYLNDTRFMTKNGFNIYKPQTHKNEPQVNFYQDYKPNFKSNPFKYSQSQNTGQMSQLQQIEQIKQQVMNNTTSFTELNQKKADEDFDSIKLRLEENKNSIKEIRDELALINEHLKLNKNDGKLDEFLRVLDPKFQKITEINDKFEKFTNQISTELDVFMNKKLNSLMEKNTMELKFRSNEINENINLLQFRLNQKIEIKFEEQNQILKRIEDSLNLNKIQIKQEPVYHKLRKKFKNDSICKKSRTNKYELLTKIKKYKQMLIEQNNELTQSCISSTIENTRSERRTQFKEEDIIDYYPSGNGTQTQFTFSDFNINNSEQVNSQDSNDSIFEF
ncbi:unnamed protein product [Brachionus calyciflorus]|uniref:Uncharacterized protein n=1 Tax=Brachionus calyciflorus TaxID=104777 RepID=A0A813XC89_9BILA|nr:unnamed protein product [Brachionus calyciflorus]